nr:hypothetical protein HK105_003163 [Polyrhizophydium stewartii]
MYTSYIGVNWQNASKRFYKDSLSEDIKRVHSLFAKARDCHVRVVPLILPKEDLIRFMVSNRYAIIILVNANLLRCKTCKSAAPASCAWWPLPGSCFGAGTKTAEDGIDDAAGDSGNGSDNDDDDEDDDQGDEHGGFMGTCLRFGKRGYGMIYETEFEGHYIVLIGYDAKKDLFYYRDPAVDAELCCISSSDLEATRMSNGTDHDLIVIKMM